MERRRNCTGCPDRADGAGRHGWSDCRARYDRYDRPGWSGRPDRPWSLESRVPASLCAAPNRHARACADSGRAASRCCLPPPASGHPRKRPPRYPQAPRARSPRCGAAEARRKPPDPGGAARPGRGKPGPPSRRPPLAASMAARMMFSASPSNSCSAKIAALPRAPFGRPAGFPLCPG